MIQFFKRLTVYIIWISLTLACLATEVNAQKKNRSFRSQSTSKSAAVAQARAQAAARAKAAAQFSAKNQIPSNSERGTSSDKSAQFSNQVVHGKQKHVRTKGQLKFSSQSSLQKRQTASQKSSAPNRGQPSSSVAQFQAEADKLRAELKARTAARLAEAQKRAEAARLEESQSINRKVVSTNGNVIIRRQVSDKAKSAAVAAGLDRDLLDQAEARGGRAAVKNAIDTLAAAQLAGLNPTQTDRAVVDAINQGVSPNNNGVIKAGIVEGFGIPSGVADNATVGDLLNGAATIQLAGGDTSSKQAWVGASRLGQGEIDLPTFVDSHLGNDSAGGNDQSSNDQLSNDGDGGNSQGDYSDGSSDFGFGAPAQPFDNNNDNNDSNVNSSNGDGAQSNDDGPSGGTSGEIVGGSDDFDFGDDDNHSQTVTIGNVDANADGSGSYTTTDSNGNTRTTVVNADGSWQVYDQDGNPIPASQGGSGGPGTHGDVNDLKEHEGQTVEVNHDSNGDGVNDTAVVGGSDDNSDDDDANSENGDDNGSDDNNSDGNDNSADDSASNVGYTPSDDTSSSGGPSGQAIDELRMQYLQRKIALWGLPSQSGTVNTTPTPDSTSNSESHISEWEQKRRSKDNIKIKIDDLPEVELDAKDIGVNFGSSQNGGATDPSPNANAEARNR